MADEEFFYERQFRLRRTPDTDVRQQELAALFAVTESTQSDKMMRYSPLKTFFPTADDVVEADVERRGETLLKQLKTYEGGRTVHQPTGGFNRGYYIGVMEGRSLGLGSGLPSQPEYAAQQPQVSRLMQESWNWAVTKGYLMQNPDQYGDWFVLTTEGEKHLEQPNSPEHRTLAEDHKMSDIRQNTKTYTRNLSRKVFIVHGHNEGTREKLARFLEQLEFTPVILHEQASRGGTVIEKVEAHSDVGFAVVLLTPDDEGREIGGTLRPRARQNVVLELGYFLGRLGRKHVCALKQGELEIPSDFEGVVYVKFDDSGGWKQALGKELEAAGFEIDWGKAMRATA